MTRDETTPYLKPGTAMARPAAYTATGPRGVWMKGATWRAVKVDVGAQRRALDAFAARKIAYDAATVIRRRKGA